MHRCSPTLYKCSTNRKGKECYAQFSLHQELTTIDQNIFKEVKYSSLTKNEIGFGEKQEVNFEENKVKFDSLNKKSVAYCELLSGPSES